MLRPLFVAVLVAGLSSGQALAKTDLLTIYQEALASSSDLAAAQADSLARQEALPQARSQLLPNIGAGAGVSRERIDIDGVGSDSYTSRYYQASLVQPLFRADSWFNYQAARSLSEQAQVEFSATQQAIILEVAEVYFNVLRASDNLAAARSEEEAFERQLEQAQERFEVGLSARTDVLEAMAGYDAARAARITAQTNLDVGYEALTRLTNRPHDALMGIRHELPVLPPTPADLQQWVDTAATQNLSLQVSRLAIASASDSLRSSRAAHAPSVDAFVRHNASFGGRGGAGGAGGAGAGAGGGLSGDTDVTSVGVELSVPLFAGGGIRSRVRESSYRLDQAEHLSEAQLRQVVEATRNLYRTVTSSVEEVEARRQSIISASAALDATQTGYEVGTRNVVDVLEAQRNLFRSVRDYNNVRYNYIIDTLRLKQVAGTLSPRDLQELSAWLNPDYDPARDFIPQFTQEEERRMSVGEQERPAIEQQRLRNSF